MNENKFDQKEAELAQTRQCYQEALRRSVVMQDQRDCLMLLIRRNCDPDVKRIAEMILK